MNLVLPRNQLPQAALTVLPFLLFFPIGIVYTGVFFFLLSLIISGNYRGRWETAKANPMFWPIVGLLVVSWVAAIVLEKPEQGFWSSFGHYQTYLFLLLFISVGQGEWQRKARKVFFAGAIYAASLYYLSLLEILPVVQPFTNYVIYGGNKSILLGILLAIAASWMLYELPGQQSRAAHAWRMVAFLYVAGAVLFLAKTRTGVLIFVLLSLVAMLRHWNWTWRSMRWALGLMVLVGLAWGLASDFRSRTLGTIKDIQAFSEGKKISDEGVRLDIYAITTELIAEQPITGHGIASWEYRYNERAKERGVYQYSTPHNDYLLHATEMGIIGMAALLWVWLSQLYVGWKMNSEDGMRLIMLGLAIMVGAMFNAILRDAVFGLAFMVLLAIPLAGVRRQGIQDIDSGAVTAR